MNWNFYFDRNALNDIIKLRNQLTYLQPTSDIKTQEDTSVASKRHE